MDRVGLVEKVTLEGILKRGKEIGHCYVELRHLGSFNSQCKGPEAGICWRTGREASSGR